MIQNGLLWVAFQGAHDDPDAILLEKALSPGPHAAGNHERDALLCQPFGKKTGLVDRRRNKLFADYLLALLINVYQGKVFTVTKVLRDNTIVYRYGIPHNNLRLLIDCKFVFWLIAFKRYPESHLFAVSKMSFRFVA
jgi:hypothetical protein